MTTETRLILPEHVTPTNYDVKLEPNFDTFTFQGAVTIKADVNQTTDSIVLNSAELEIQDVSVDSEGIKCDVLDVSINPDNETISIKLAKELDIGTSNLRVQISFIGSLNDRLLGFYRSQYTDINGNEKFLAATQFESTDARRAFPCWDEPSKKATFDVSLDIPDEMVAVSNMPIVSDVKGLAGRKTITFDTTPIMSTYLLAFIVGELGCIEQSTKSGTLMRVWTTAGKEEQGRFALQTSVDLLDYYNDYFGIPFPLPKLDHLAIPDFAAGAMENWGAITYREVALLVDPENSSAGTRQIVAAIISHEMAHMWFGDLVTMNWWNDLWLNESFASWMGDKAVDAIHPEWDMWTQFLTADTASAFSLDGLSNSHPIEQEVNNPAEIGQLFDAISYSKGGSILRMLEDFIGPLDFQKGIRTYLTDHSYENAETQDLWNALEVSSGKPVAKVMDSWVKQTGFPMITFDTNDNSSNINLSQTRFLYEHIEGEPEHVDETAWYVPIKISSSEDNNVATILMESRDLNIQLDTNTVSETSWFKLNPDQTGFYRTKYSESELVNLKNAISKDQLSPRDRLGLQGDYYALVRAGYTSVTDFLDLAGAYKDESDASVLSDLATGLRGIENIISELAFHSSYQLFCKGIFAGISKKVGWDKKTGEGHLDALLRSTSLGNSGHYGDQSVLDQAISKFNDHVTEKQTIHPDIRTVVFNLAAQQGDRSVYNQMWTLEKSTDLQEEKVRLHSALSNFGNKDLLQETLNKSLSEDIRVQDSIRVIVTVASSALGRSLAWDFIRNNWEEIDRRYGDGGFALMRLVSIVSGFTTSERLQEVETFFEENPTPAAERTIRQAKERIRINQAWLERYSDQLSKFLS